MATKVESTVVLAFHYERETKTKNRFQEMMAASGGDNLSPAPKDNAVVEKLYVSKKQLKKWGNPTILRVTIEAVQ